MKATMRVVVFFFLVDGDATTGAEARVILDKTRRFSCPVP